MILKEKIIYIQQEPPEVRLPNKDILDYSNLAISPFNIEHNIEQIIAPPVLQWTYDINVELKEKYRHAFSNTDNNSNLENILFASPPEKTFMFYDCIKKIFCSRS